jgi:transcription elongation factor GreA
MRTERAALSVFVIYLTYRPTGGCFFIRPFLFGQRAKRQALKDMTEKTFFLTAEGYEKLRAELEHLKTVRRHEVAEKIRSAKEEGDLAENAGYDQAKEEQAFVEGRIMTLERILRKTAIIEDKGPTDRVGLGSRVTVVEVNGDWRSPPETYHLVGSAEADPTSGRISNESPLGKALMGQNVGQSVTVSAPSGLIHFEIVGIH